MDVYVARQPIFNSDEKVVAYELLYREADVGNCSDFDGDSATSSVIINSLVMGLEKLTYGKPAFINFTQNLHWSMILP